MDINDLINDHLSRFDLDIRKTGDARYVDQKCTPDIVSFIADCVLNLVATKPTFVIKDLWSSQYFIKNCRVIFSKPWANDPKAANEYDKLLSQPLKLLAYAHILNDDKKGKRHYYSICNQDILEYIALKDRYAYNFLYEYFSKVLKDSYFFHYLEDYKEGKIERDEVYDRYIRLIQGNTPTQSELDIKRMFHKVFNIYASWNGLVGSKGSDVILFSDLMYNRINSRDHGKKKSETRIENKLSVDKEREDIILDYQVQKAISQIRKIEISSEVKDSLANAPATQVHHIFPKSAFPQIAHYMENLILLTASQHFTKAHPNNKTQVVNKDYQCICLLAKANTIEKSLSKYGERYYRKESFIHVINTGLNQSFASTYSFKTIKSEIVTIYNAL